jgi:hypothetical protein
MTEREPPKLVGISAYPGTSASIRRAKAWGGLAGFAAAFVASHFHGAELSAALLRGLGGGLLCYLVTWAAAVTAWRHVVIGAARRAARRGR